MDLSKHIAELLRENECVILPGFGGFIARYTPARINTVNHRIYPPAREVTFNKKLGSDDGLLTGHLSRALNVSYEEAGKKVASFREEIFRDIDEKGLFQLGNLGSFSRNSEGNLVFEPAFRADIWNDGFGLSQILAPPINRRESTGRDRATRSSRKPSPVRHKMPVRVKLTIMAATPIILFLLFGIINPGSVRNLQSQYQEMSGTLPWLITRTMEPANTRVVKRIEPVYIQPLPFSVKPSFTAPLPRKETRGLSTISTIDDADNLPRYHIITATFTDRDIALRYTSEMQEAGYPAIIVGTNQYGHFRVSLIAFMRKQEALDELKSVRSNINPEAWLLRQ